MDRQIFAQLRDNLTHLYSTYNDAVRIAYDAGVSTERIAIDDSAINRWHAILKEAEKTNQVAELLRIIANEYGPQKSLLDLYLAYQRGQQEHLQKAGAPVVMTGMPVVDHPRSFVDQASARRFAYRMVYIGVVTLALLLGFNHEKILAAASAVWRTSVTVINSNTGEVDQTMAVDEPVISPDNTRLATVRPDGTVSLLDLTTGAEIAHSRYETTISSLQFSPDSTRLIIITSDGTVHIWDVSNGEQLSALHHDTAVTAALFSPDDTRLLTTDVTGATYLWDVIRGNEITTDLRGAQVKSAQFSPNGQYLALTNADGAFYLADHNGQRLSTLADTASVQNLRFSPDGTRLATTDSRGAFSLWDLNNGKQLAYTDHTMGLDEFYFSPDSSRLVTVEQTGETASRIQLWNSSSGRPLAAFSYAVTITQIQFSPDSAYLAVAGINRRADLHNVGRGIVYLINSALGDQVTQLQHAMMLNNILFSPDSTLLAAAASDGMVYFWQTSNGIPILHVAHAETITKMRFSKNGERLITITTTAKGDNLYLWDAITGREIQRFRYPTAVDDVNFIASSTRFVVIAESNAIR